MMAVAICIAVQQLPSEFVEASLSLYSRMKLPLAPPLTLVLSDCRFQPFPVQASQGNSPVIGLSGESLELRSHGKAQQEAFVQEVRLHIHTWATCNALEIEGEGEGRGEG